MISGCGLTLFGLLGANSRLFLGVLFCEKAHGLLLVGAVPGGACTGRRDSGLAAGD